ncbi:hypothetical protein RhiirA5_376620 [Rhizophagus irregularis]|uniref:Uncharacterized protein n=1 Tax=Rhizophagus irregularis TaxID=588596 RepID=A0A2N0PMC7_9GLOM|nr:hypothetical protein RhiirA5_376620 [Rhizophagus irregularis]
MTKKMTSIFFFPMKKKSEIFKMFGCYPENFRSMWVVWVGSAGVWSVGVWVGSAGGCGSVGWECGSAGWECGSVGVWVGSVGVGVGLPSLCLGLLFIRSPFRPFFFSSLFRVSKKQSVRI